MDDKEANKQDEKPQMVAIMLGNGQPLPPVPLLARDSVALFVQVPFPRKRKNGKLEEVPMIRAIPYSTILWWDILPDEEETNDGGTEG